jgi:hypothetical protein
VDLQVDTEVSEEHTASIFKTETAQLYNPEGQHWHLNRRENLK